MNNIYKKYDLSDAVINLVNDASDNLNETYKEYEKNKEINQIKVIHAMQKNNLAASDFYFATGYGYGDIGRDKIEEIFKDIFNAEDALVRTSIVSGTHAIYIMLSSVLNHGDEFIYVTGAPYDTIQKSIGLVGDLRDSLMKKGIMYRQVELKGATIDFEALESKITKNTKAIVVQRSIGYEFRKAINLHAIKNDMLKFKEKHPDIVIMYDNCYGEFTDSIEPTDIGADIIAGSLLKNLGAGISLGGGYLVGRKDLIELAADRLYAPGLGKELGLSYGTLRTTLQGLYMSPRVVCEALKTQSLFSYVFTKLGFECTPEYNEHKSDIVCAIKFKDPDILIKFCKSIQKAACVDSFLTPEPWDMPGYENKIIMASGSFIDGSSIEISADGPIREPYIAYFQGSMSLEQGKLGLMIALQDLVDSGNISL